MRHAQPGLFDVPPALPEGFAYRDDLISPAEEAALVAGFAALPFKPFEFQGYLGRRRVVSFGWRYDHNDRSLSPAVEPPPFVAPLRDKAAAFAGLEPNDLQHMLITEYEPGAPIGWHRDRPEFAEVIGVSFLAPCPFRFRRRRGTGWERASLTVRPRSAYLLSGPARSEWEHSIPALDALRYSVTFRRLRADLAATA
jgi:alkylated DNA repair dioxygenase AlkB